MKKNIKAALLSAFIFPGLGQIYKGSKLKGFALIFLANLVFLLTLGFVIAGTYRLAHLPGFAESAEPAQIAHRLYNETPAFPWLMGIFLCLWLYGVLDALLGKLNDPSP